MASEKYGMVKFGVKITRNYSAKFPRGMESTYQKMEYHMKFNYSCKKHSAMDLTIVPHSIESVKGFKKC